MLIVCGLHCLCFKLILWYIAWDIENDIDHHHSVHNMCFIWNVYSYVQWMSWVGHIIFHFHASVMVDTIGCEWNFNQIVVYNQWYKFSMAWYTPQHIIRQWQAFHIFIFQSRYKSHRKSRYRQYHASLYDACRWNAYSSWSWIFNDKITLCEYIKKKIHIIWTTSKDVDLSKNVVYIYWHATKLASTCSVFLQQLSMTLLCGK